jgi:hypothetical protein
MSMDNVVKFPSTVSRRAHARKPRASINGTPEERAAKENGPSFVEFLRGFKAYFIQEFERGRDVDQIFAGLEGTAMKLRRRTARLPKIER